ncbi:Transcription elongation factor GreA [uncultured Desulfatiglans sp.]|uniref:Transcription elongation factor GreA n=1 Tax=Uncultured Desulfatiglans sp. TaxID=1748965 RepID=A0A653AIN3_UNCDX|nr:Transcription elongation factor GreA [uncultured Desulfatiglans sp.]
MEKVPFTKEGLAKLKQELTHLVNVERPQNIRAIAEARSHGDLSENAEYHAAKEKQSFLEGKINELTDVVAKAEVVSTDSHSGDRVVFGNAVLLYNLQTDEEIRYQLVGPYESDPENGRISVTSPLGQALIGKRIGDEIRVQVPRGVQEYEILEIS